jgi:type I restriction enzyme S subunit
LYRVRAGQIIYSRLFAFEGAFALVPEEMDGWFTSNEYPTFDVNPAFAIPEFVRLAICRPRSWQELASRTVGMGHRRQRLQPTALLDYEIDVPSVSEQRSIVDAVETATEAVVAAVAEQRAAFQLLAAMIEKLLVPSGSWDDGVPSAWAVVRLDDVADVRSGITKGRKTEKPMLSYPFIRAANVQGGFLDLREIKLIDATADEVGRFRLEAEDILMVEGGNAEHLGRGWMWEGQIAQCLHQNHVFRARPTTERILPRFLAYAIAASPARAYCLDKAKKTTNLASINKTQISGMPVALPPLDEQRRIIDALDVARAVAVAALQRRDDLVHVRDRLTDGLLTGTVTVGASDFIRLVAT